MKIHSITIYPITLDILATTCIRISLITVSLVGIHTAHAEDLTTAGNSSSPSAKQQKSVISKDGAVRLQFADNLQEDKYSPISSQNLIVADNGNQAHSNLADANTPKPQKGIKLQMSGSIDHLDPASLATDGLGVATSGLDTSEPAELSNPAPGAIVIQGDTMQMYMDRRMKASGNASIFKDNDKIYGDIIEYDVQNSQLRVQGNARIESGDTIITGPSLKMNMGESIGEMQNASFRMDNQFSGLPQIGVAKATDVLNRGYTDPNQGLPGAQQPSLNDQNIDGNTSSEPGISKKIGTSRGDAETVFFEGENKKRLKNARYTTCAADSDDWYIKAGEMKIDDYTQTATAKNARVDFKGVPILYTPYISFSFLNQRKSGFLSPTFGTTSRSGFELLTPYYWNISPDMDATFASRILTKRGLQVQGEFRYLGENYSGTNNIEYLSKDLTTDKTRYYLNFKHQQSFNNGWSASYNLEKVSDDQYFSDMTTRIITTSRVNLPQQGNVAYNDDVWSFNALVQRYQTLNSTNNPTLSFPYSRLPQLTLNGNKDFGMVNANIYNEFVSFDRDPANPRFTSTASGGTLTTGVTGNRLTTYPSISLPMAQPYGYVTPKFGVSHTSYSLNNAGFTLDGVNGQYESASRTLPIFSLDSGLFYDRNVKVVKNNYTQTLEPRLFYVYIPYQDQSQLPIFDTARADLNLGTLFLENQFTGNDRINNANQLSLAVTSRMINAKTGEQRLAVTVGQRFYFADERVGLPGQTLRTGNTSDFVTSATARLTNHWNVDTAWQYNSDTSQTVKANIGARYNPEPGKVLNLSYRFTQDSLEQYNVSAQWPLGKGWYGMGRWNYSLRDSQPIEGLGGVEYDAGCWQARGVIQRVATATANANYALFFQLELGGLASIGSNPMTLLNRTIPGYKSSGLLPDSYRQQNYE